MNLIDNFSNRLKSIRCERGLSLEELSKVVNIPAQTLNRYELNQRTPKIDIAAQIAARLGINPLWLNGYDVPLNSPEYVTAELPFKLNKHECSVIIAYHNQPTMQPAVDRILGLDRPEFFEAKKNIQINLHPKFTEK